MSVEGANTSFQVHLRVNPAEFTRAYNAAQLAIAPVLAAAGNSPTFLGHRLWEETRIALCKQSIDDRDTRGPRRRLARMAFGTGWLRDGPLELFAESVRLHEPLLPVLGAGNAQRGDRGQVPPLHELRLHQGTVWRWNRAIYDPAAGGHLRIEMRGLPAGPTMIDMMANAAFLLGLSLWLAEQNPRWTYDLSFERAEHNFYRAAQYGLAALLTWPVQRRWSAHRPSARARGRAAAVGPGRFAARRRGAIGSRPPARRDRQQGSHRSDRCRLATRSARRGRTAARPAIRTGHHAAQLPRPRRHRTAGTHLARPALASSPGQRSNTSRSAQRIDSVAPQTSGLRPTTDRDSYQVANQLNRLTGGKGRRTGGVGGSDDHGPRRCGCPI